MAKSYKGGKFGINFDGFLDFARKIDEAGGDNLKRATENALKASKEYVDAEIVKAMDTSPYSFNRGEHYSTGRARASAEEVSNMPIEWEGTVAKAFIGVNVEKAPEALILASGGNPHLRADTKLRNALKVKGKVRAEVNRIQQEEFQKVISEVFSDG